MMVPDCIVTVTIFTTKQRLHIHSLGLVYVLKGGAMRKREKV